MPGAAVELFAGNPLGAGVVLRAMDDLEGSATGWASAVGCVGGDRIASARPATARAIVMQATTVAFTRPMRCSPRLRQAAH
jgi:hypothetical protein